MATKNHNPVNSLSNRAAQNRESNYSDAKTRQSFSKDGYGNKMDSLNSKGSSGEASSRITSYNVCYTKLLRAGIAPDHAFIDDPGHQPGQEQIGERLSEHENHRRGGRESVGI